MGVGDTQNLQVLGSISLLLCLLLFLHQQHQVPEASQAENLALQGSALRGGFQEGRLCCPRVLAGPGVPSLLDSHFDGC